MSNYTLGKYVRILSNKLSNAKIIGLARDFGLEVSAHSLNCDIERGDDYICVYEKLYTSLGDEIKASLVFKDFVVDCSNIRIGSPEYVRNQMAYRSFLQYVLKETNPEYMQDFAQYLLDQERAIDEKYESKKNTERHNLEAELGLNYNEPELEK